MELLHETYTHLQTAYADYSTRGESEADKLAKTLQECIKHVNTDDLAEVLRLQVALDGVRISSHNLMSSPPNRGFELRQIYTDSCITHCLLELTRGINGEREMVWMEC